MAPETAVASGVHHAVTRGCRCPRTAAGATPTARTAAPRGAVSSASTTRNAGHDHIAAAATSEGQATWASHVRGADGNASGDGQSNETNESKTERINKNSKL